MASEIRVNQIQNRSGLGTVTFSDTGVVISGITTISDLRTSGTSVVAAGTTAAPSISPSGDSNTGIFFPSADTIAFGEGGVEALRIDSSGRVGVGTDNPSQKLHVRSVIRIDGSTNPYIVLNDGTNTGYIQIADGRLDLNHNGNISFAPGGGVKATINTSGNLVFAGSGQGIDFSATANSSGTMTSELLDDYEEGTWTPTINGSPSYTGTRTGDYTKIGNIVHISFIVQITSNSGIAVISIGGLPFQIDGNTRPIGPVQTSDMSWTGAGSITLYGNNGAASMGMIRSSDAGTEDYLYIQDDTAFLIRGSLTYTTNS